VTPRTPDSAELIPLADRIRWMTGCRALLLAVLVAVRFLAGVDRPLVTAVLWCSVGWLVGHGLVSLLTIRLAAGQLRERRLAVTVFTAGLLGDGVVLVAAWYAFGGLDGPVGYVVMLHGVAVTLLGSFRAGAKLALWHSLLALVVVEAAATGSFGPARTVEVPTAGLSMYLMVLWAAVLATAAFAAVNERELRRRRYDSEVLRRFGLAMADAHDQRAIAGQMAEFARDELLASRVAVVVSTGPGTGFRIGLDGPEGTPEPVPLPMDW
jgi:hypothetical protein